MLSYFCILTVVSDALLLTLLCIVIVTIMLSI